MNDALTKAMRIKKSWSSLVGDYDNALSKPELRHFLVQTGTKFEGLNWREALRERREGYPEFFAANNYDWCDDQSCFDFTIEAAYQVRAINAAIGLWLVEIDDKPKNADLGRIVARSTYMAKFEGVTPSVREGEEFDYLVSPLGWVEFLHTFFAGFIAWWPCARNGTSVTQDAHWLRIAANIIASTVTELDYEMPETTDRIVKTVQEFTGAYPHFSAVTETSLSTDLSYGAHDFAICHEVSHIAARDFRAPDECRADRWGLAAYFGSWPLRPGLFMDVGQLDSVRASIAPFAFACAMRALLGARILLLRHLAIDSGRLRGMQDSYRECANRLASLQHRNGEILRARVNQNDPDHRKQQEDAQVFFAFLAAYEHAFLKRMSELSPGGCAEAQMRAQK